MSNPMHGEGSSAADEPTGRPVESMSYTEASAELDAIVHFFEQRDVDVDQLVGKLVRATAIVEELDKRLRKTRLQVEQLVPRLAAVLADDDRTAAAAAGTPGQPVERPPSAGLDVSGQPARRDVEEPGDAPSGSALF